MKMREEEIKCGKSSQEEEKKRDNEIKAEEKIRKEKVREKEEKGERKRKKNKRNEGGDKGRKEKKLWKVAFRNVAKMRNKNKKF
ncbi:hypothetical protein RF55_13214 [Lasius niger]|uniref:Uncharacterized protein n=1 Tax=Lasius niger TaxID=67767 RepID=A0A0J7KAQ7_LASNI|nr:hypothetical protein RF55_13214 [Lasius niger]